MSKKYLTFDDLSAAHKTMSEEEFAVLEAKFWADHGINPETDLYSAEETERRFNTMMAACLRVKA